MPFKLAFTEGKTEALKSISRILSVVAVVTGVLILLGWQFNVDVLKSGWTNTVPVNPLTAVLFIASGISVFILGSNWKNKKTYWIAKILAALVLLIAFTETMPIVGFQDLPTDKILFHEQVIAAGNQMAPITAINFVLVGLALLVSEFKGQILRNPTHLLILLSLFLVMLSIIGYLYGVIYLYEIAHARYYPIAIFTAIIFFILDVAILLMKPEDGFIKLASTKGPAGLSMRWIIPTILFITVIIGGVSFYLQKAGILNYELLVTLTVTSYFFMTSMVIWWNSRSLLNMDEQRKSAADQVIHQRSLLQSVISSVGEAIIVVDQEYKVMVSNQMAAKLVDVNQDEMIGKDLRNYITIMKNDKPLPAGESLDLIATKLGKMVAVDLRDNLYLKNAAGKIFPIAGVIAPLKGSENIKGLVAVFRDISKDKEIDIAKTEFVSLASHQLRTPLSTINWYTEMLQNGDAGATNEKQSEYLDEIMHASKRMIGLVNSLLSVSQIESGIFSAIPQRVNVLEIARVVLEELGANIAEKKLSIEETYDDKIPVIMADPHYIKIIFQNLIANAVNYSLKEGKIKINISKGKDELLLKVSDTGYGIPESAKSKIFLKLYRADNIMGINSKGTGLGLYLVKLIVDKSGGKIRFESKENRGTTFYVSLPYKFTKKNNKQQNQKPPLPF